MRQAKADVCTRRCLTRHLPCMSFSPQDTRIAIHSSVKPLGSGGDHGLAVIVIIFMSLSTVIHSFILIEMSSSPARIHLIDAHQLRAIHPHSLSDYTRHHPSLSVRVNPPCRRTDICVFCWLLECLRKFSRGHECFESLSFEREIETLLIRSVDALLLLLHRIRLVALMNWW
jgi:hypothetical protein